jgi:hypothetical protein
MHQPKKQTFPMKPSQAQRLTQWQRRYQQLHQVSPQVASSVEHLLYRAYLTREQ